MEIRIKRTLSRQHEHHGNHQLVTSEQHEQVSHRLEVEQQEKHWLLGPKLFLFEAQYLKNS